MIALPLRAFHCSKAAPRLSECPVNNWSIHPSITAASSSSPPSSSGVNQQHINRRLNSFNNYRLPRLHHFLQVLRLVSPCGEIEQICMSNSMCFIKLRWEETKDECDLSLKEQQLTTTTITRFFPLIQIHLISPIILPSSVQETKIQLLN